MKLQEDIVSEFDHFSEDYTRDMERMVPYYEKLLSSLPEFIADNLQPANILDMGCGNGNSTSVFIAKYPDANYTLVDVSTEMLNICKSRFANSNITYLKCFFKELIFPPESVDIVTACFSFHHLNSNEKKSIFQNIYGWLRPGGIFTSSDLMISKSNDDHPRLLEEWEAYARNKGCTDEEWKWMMDHYDTFDHPDNLILQEQWLKDAGFQKTKIVWNNGHWVCLQAIKI